VQPQTISIIKIRRTQQNRKIRVTDGTYSQIKRFNKYGELTKLKDRRISVKLTYNKNGQIVKKIEKINRRRVVYRYTYDQRGRLTQVKKGRRVVERYSYDNNGNRATERVYGQNITASYTLDDQLEVYGDNTYRYDNDGYLAEKITPNGTTTYSYGTLGELKRVVTPTKTIEYLHNANNQRVAKKVDGVIVEKYLWANLTTLLAVYDANDNLKQRFEYADSRMPISMTQNGQKYYLHYDQVGTLKAISNSNQRVIKKITYDSYGNILNETNQAFNVPFGFAGGLYDSDTKLTRFGYRDYDAHSGKWTAKDPIDFGGGDLNLYGYVLQNPISGIDPSGLLFEDGFFSIFVSGFKNTLFANELSDKAIEIAKNSGLKGMGNGPRDAYRHCVWSCLMSKEMGVDEANVIGYIHEVHGDSIGGGNGLDEYDMDMHNNICGQNNSKNPKSCKDSCMDSLNGGWLHVLPENRWQDWK